MNFESLQAFIAFATYTKFTSVWLWNIEHINMPIATVFIGGWWFNCHVVLTCQAF